MKCNLWENSAKKQLYQQYSTQKCATPGFAGSNVSATQLRMPCKDGFIIDHIPLDSLLEDLA
jgi:hypothetical protein